MASNIPLTEIREEGTVDSAAEIAIVPRDHATVDSPTSSPRICPPVFSRPRAPRRGSSASRVDVDYFDKEGVNELSRTLSRMSTHETLPVTYEAGRDSSAPSQLEAASDETLATADRPFDFEKGFRNYVKECVILTLSRILVADLCRL